MKNTQIITAGVIAAGGMNSSNETKVTLDTACRKFTLETIITLGAQNEGQGMKEVEVRFATSNISGVAATQAALLRLYADAKSIRIKTGAGDATYCRSKPFVPAGAYLYVWVNTPTFNAAAQLDVWLNEDVGAVSGGGGGSAITVQGIAGGTPIIEVGAGLQVVLTPAVSASPDYTIGDSLGGKLVLANAVRIAGGYSRLENLIITDKANQKPSGYILIFNADPTAATLTDNAQFVMSTDYTKIVARIDVSQADYQALGTDNVAVADIPYSGRLLKSAATTSLWAAFIVASAPNLGAVDDIQLTFNFSAAS